MFVVISDTHVGVYSSDGLAESAAKNVDGIVVPVPGMNRVHEYAAPKPRRRKPVTATEDAQETPETEDA